MSCVCLSSQAPFSLLRDTGFPGPGPAYAGAGQAGVSLPAWPSLVKCSAHRRCFPGAPTHCVVPSPFCKVSLFPPWLQEVQRDPKAELTRGRRKTLLLPRTWLFPTGPWVHVVPLPGPFIGHVLFCHWPLTSFTTRQFSDPMALFVMLYFPPAASGKWVLYLGTSCLNTQSHLTHPQSHVS